jgi:hypothetical protein
MKDLEFLNAKRQKGRTGFPRKRKGSGNLRFPDKKLKKKQK